MQATARELGFRLDFHPAKPGNELHRAIVYGLGEPNLKIDIVRDAPPHFGETITQPDGLILDSIENIAVGKLLALYGRSYPRDFVDVYFLSESGQDIRELIERGKQKDPGLIDTYLADTLRQILKFGPEHMPNTLKPLDIEKMKKFFLKLADELSQGRE